MLQTLGILVAVALILFLSVKRVSLSLSIILGSTIIALSSGVSTELLLRILTSVLQDLSTYEIVLDVALIGVLGYVLKETQLILESIQALRKLLPKKALIAIIPAIFGLLPMPGGALISAPLIDNEATELGLSPDRKTFVNMWFRHIWFFILPIASSIILAAKLAEVNLYSLAAMQLPTFSFMTLLGILFLRKIHFDEKKEEGNASYRPIILGLTPIFVAVILNVIGVWLPLALSVGILTTFLIKRNRLRDAHSLVWKGLNKDLIVATFSVMVFRRTIEETQAFAEIFATLQNLGVPPFFFLTIFPFLIGFIAAIPTSGIGVGFSLVLPMFPDLSLPMVSLIYQSVIIGYELSPMHLCLILTNEHYHSKLQLVYHLWGPLILATYLFGLSSPILLMNVFK